MTTIEHCIYRAKIQAKAEIIFAKTYNLKAFCFPISEKEIEQGYFFRKTFKAGERIVKASDFNLRAFRINIKEAEKTKFMHLKDVTPKEDEQLAA